MERLDYGAAEAFLGFSNDGIDWERKSERISVENQRSDSLARHILGKILSFRRLASSSSICESTCSLCQSPHLHKIISSIEAKSPILMVLPAFPGKSPNLSKVLSPLPDMAEQLALQFLEHLCDQIKEIYPHGAHIILCSDGRVFSDIVGMQENDVTVYQRELENMIGELRLSSLSTFNLDEMCPDQNFVRLRLELMENFGSSKELLREKIVRGSTLLGHPEDKETHRMYCGITRFLVEDSTFPGQTKSRSAIQKESKIKAYEVIRRSNAWSELIARRFPEAVRLSIHPQACGSRKLGLRLIGTEDWMTPWHGVAVKIKDRFTLLKRAEAEVLGAQLVFSKNGRPSYFEV